MTTKEKQDFWNALSEPQPISDVFLELDQLICDKNINPHYHMDMCNSMVDYIRNKHNITVTIEETYEPERDKKLIRINYNGYWYERRY